MTDTRPVMEMSGWASTIEGRPFLCGLCVSDQGKILDRIDAEIAFTLAKGAKGLYLHEDDLAHRADVLTAGDRVRAADLLPIFGLHVVEGVPGNTNDPLIFTSDGAAATGITLNVRTWGKDLGKLWAGVEWAIGQVQSGRVKMLWVTNWDTCDWPELRDYLTQVLGLIGTPALFPGQSPPVVITPPAPPPPAKGKGKDKIALAGAVGSAIFWLVRWWRGRRR